MLANQEFLLYAILKAGEVKNTVLTSDANTLGFIDLDEHCRIQLVEFVNQFNSKIHKILIGDQQSFEISTPFEFKTAMTAIAELLTGKADDAFIKSIQDSFAAVLKQAYLDIQQQEYIASLMKDWKDCSA